MKDKNLLAMEAFKKFLKELESVKNEEDMYTLIGSFSFTYKPIDAKELTFEFPIRKAQKGFLKEIENVLKMGIYHDVAWHKKEFHYQAKEMVDLLETN